MVRRCCSGVRPDQLRPIFNPSLVAVTMPFDEFICYFNQGGLMDPALVKQSMTLFAQEVMPHFQ